MIQKLFWILLLTIVASSAGLGQNTSYPFDNFDTSTGVKVYVEPPPPLAKRCRSTGEATLIIEGSTKGSEALMIRRTVMPVDPSMNVGNVSSSLRGFTTGNESFDSYVAESAKRNGLDPLLIYSIMHQESSFKQRAISPKGARGLMQLMPGTAARYGVTNIFDPKQNIEGGARYMRFLLDLFDGDLSLALAGYNAGEGAVQKYGLQIPPYAETQEYVRRISRRYNLLRDPNAALYASSLSRAELAKLNAKQPTPLAIYERSVLAVRLPDGRLQLMTQ